MSGIARRTYQAKLDQFSDRVPAFLKPILMARGVYCDGDLSSQLRLLPSSDSLSDIDKAADLLATAITAKRDILIVGDYDVDGAASTTLAIRALRAMLAEKVHYIIPNRICDGYGLTQSFAERQIKDRPYLVLTVDNGIRSHQAVRFLKEKGSKVLISDHHLPGEDLPEADAVVNPNRADCAFPAKNLAGVGVCFYLMCHLRRLLRERGHFIFNGKTPPNMAQFLDLVALGTLADMVPMDRTNRILVGRGLDLIRQGGTRPGIKQLLSYQHNRVNSVRLIFEVIPVLNAAGRLDDMSLAVEFLLEDDSDQARVKNTKLQQLNRQRKEKIAAMRKQVNAMLGEEASPPALCLYDENWHLGLIGPLAGSLCEAHCCPVVVFAKETASEDEARLRGSVRAPEPVELDVLFDALRRQAPDLLLRYGGHKRAAGITIAEQNLNEFQARYKRLAAKYQLRARQTPILTDGSLPVKHLTDRDARFLATYLPWGSAFPPPLFDDEFTLLAQEISATGTLRLKLRRSGFADAILAVKFQHSSTNYPIQATKLRLVYRLLSEPWINGGKLAIKIERLEEQDV